jgi:hypothetical protein
LQDPPKFTQSGIFGSKTNHLATLRPEVDLMIIPSDFDQFLAEKIHKKQLK